jgi:proteasome maturation protein
MRHESVSYAMEYSAQHPVQSLQTSATREWSSKLDSVRRTYGSHMAMRLATEREFFSRNRRLPGLESSKIALQTLTGADETIEFSDYLDDPQMRPVIPKLEVHGLMEIKLGLM